MKQPASITNDHSVAAWKRAREQQLSKSKTRGPLTEFEIALNLLVSKSMEAGRLQLMAGKKLKMLNGICPGWAAFYAVYEQVKDLKALITTAVGDTPDARAIVVVGSKKTKLPEEKKR